MSAFRKILVGTAGLAAVVAAASPAAAQYYPGNGYNNGYNNGYSNGYNNPGQAVGNVINGVIAATQYGGYQYGNYGYGQTYRYGGMTIPANVAVDQCARAIAQNGRGGYGDYNGTYSGGYGSSWNGGGQVTGITNIEARNNGALRVHGVASTNGGGYGGYNGGGYGAPNVSFTCKVDYSGRVIDLSFDRLRGNYGYNNGYRGY